MEEQSMTVYELAKAKDQEIVSFYREKKGHLSHSSLRKFNVSPMNFLLAKILPEEKTTAMDLGSMIHMLLFEQQSFKEKYFILDDRAIMAKLLNKYKAPRITNDYKAWAEELTAKNPGKTAIAIDDFLLARDALKRMFANKEFADFYKKLTGHKSEHAIVFGVNGYAIKSVLDLDTDDVIFDLKYVSFNSLRATTNAYWGDEYQTWVQQGLYSSIYDYKKRHVMGYLHKTGDIMLREVPVDALQLGREEFEKWVDAFDKCIREEGTFLLDSNYWTKPEERLLYIPAWRLPDDLS